ncbi:MAG: 50S ribosomal protein L21 [Alphaproteobacteria bacterium]
MTLEDVLFVSDGKKATVGEPVVKGASVIVAKIAGTKRGPKITIFKEKAPSSYRHQKGHRQELTLLQVTDIKAA